jgi:hypothetical protein
VERVRVAIVDEPAELIFGDAAALRNVRVKADRRYEWLPGIAKIGAG